MTLLERLQALFAAVSEEAASNPAFAKRLESALSEDGSPADRDAVKRTSQGGTKGSNSSTERGRRRRKVPFLDPFEIYSEDPDELRRRLAKLDIEPLKDIVAGFGMDSRHLALKWKQPERLINLIVETVESRSRRGDAFRVEATREQRFKELLGLVLELKDAALEADAQGERWSSRMANVEFKMNTLLKQLADEPLPPEVAEYARSNQPSQIMRLWQKVHAEIEQSLLRN